MHTLEQPNEIRKLEDFETRKVRFESRSGSKTSIYPPNKDYKP